MRGGIVLITASVALLSGCAGTVGPHPATVRLALATHATHATVAIHRVADVRPVVTPTPRPTVKPTPRPTAKPKRRVTPVVRPTAHPTPRATVRPAPPRPRPTPTPVQRPVAKPTARPTAPGVLTSGPVPALKFYFGAAGITPATTMTGTTVTHTWTYSELVTELTPTYAVSWGNAALCVTVTNTTTGWPGTSTYYQCGVDQRVAYDTRVSETGIATDTITLTVTWCGAKCR